MNYAPSVAYLLQSQVHIIILAKFSSFAIFTGVCFFILICFVWESASIFRWVFLSYIWWIHFAFSVRTGLEGPGLSVSQKILYCISFVGGQYIWSRLQSFSAFRRWGDSEQVTLISSFWKLTIHFHSYNLKYPFHVVETTSTPRLGFSAECWRIVQSRFIL